MSFRHQRHDWIITVLAIAVAMLVVQDRGVPPVARAVMLAVAIALIAFALWLVVDHERHVHEPGLNS